MAKVWPLSKAPTRYLGAVADQLLRLRARHLRLRFGVGVEQLDRVAHLAQHLDRELESPRWQPWPISAWKPERGSSTPSFSGAAARAPLP